MASRFPKSVSRRILLAGAPLGVLAGAARVTLAQPAAADPVSFYLGQVLALATLQAQAVGRLRPLLLSPNAADATWRAAASAEASVIGAVASVLGAMEPPPELATSVGELRLASDAFRGASDAALSTANGDLAALDIAGARLAEGATHILLWLDALTAETGNDWGDGLRTLTASASFTSVPTDASVETPASPSATLPAIALTPTEPVEAPPTEEAPIEVAQAAEALADRQARNRQNRRNRQNQQATEQEEQPAEEDRQNRQDRQNRRNRETPAADE